jgi:hypothetical protein
MDYFDLIKELWKGEPNPKKAEKAMKILGWICIFAAIWNFALYYIGPFEKSPFNLPPSYPYFALTGLLLIGILFLRSARGIRERELYGKRSGQLAVVLSLAFVIVFIFFVFPREAVPLRNDKISIIFSIFFFLFLSQFVLPAYFGIRYLERLPVKDNLYTGDELKYKDLSRVSDEKIGRESSLPQTKYKEALLPFGIFGTFAFIGGIPLLLIFILERYFGPGVFPHLFMPTFVLIFFGPVVYNYIPSRFQRERNVVASYTGGGSILLFHGSWPFFRLMVYEDGIEVRVEFNRFFIPYNKMGDLPSKIGFFSRGVLIKSDLPGVPSGIRFSGFGMKKILKVLNEMRNKCLAKSTEVKGLQTRDTDTGTLFSIEFGGKGER